jgi:hypothetical protein
MYDLITSIREESFQVKTLCENISTAEFGLDLLFESADKYIGNAIAALNAGKNPLETMPGSEAVLAGLILLAKETNREAMNLKPKKFDVVTQFTNEKESVKKAVAQKAKDHGPSLIKNIRAYVADPDRRVVLKKKLVHLQNVYSQAKQQSRKNRDVSKVINR